MTEPETTSRRRIKELEVMVADVVVEALDTTTLVFFVGFVSFVRFRVFREFRAFRGFIS